MFCENCGSKIQQDYKFCIRCGNSVLAYRESSVMVERPVLGSDKWWHRLLRVIYIILYLPLLLVIPLVWSMNAYYGEYGVALSQSLLALVIYIFIARLIKITFLYIFFAQKPYWRRELRKLF